MKNESSFSWERYHKTPVIGIVRGLSADIVLEIAQVYAEAGFCTLEVTMNTEGATDLITILRKEFPQLNIGAGTVCTMMDLDNALTAGSQFIVTPILNEEVIRSSVAQDIPIFPGAFSPSEIYKAWSLGASAVKIFPATQVGVQYIKDILGPLDTVKLLPTGGVSLNNIKAFFEAGAVGVGMGSSLFDKKLIQEENFVDLKNHLIKVKTEILEFVEQ